MNLASFKLTELVKAPWKTFQTQKTFSFSLIFFLNCVSVQQGLNAHHFHNFGAFYSHCSLSFLFQLIWQSDSLQFFYGLIGVNNRTRYETARNSSIAKTQILVRKHFKALYGRVFCNLTLWHPEKLAEILLYIRLRVLSLVSCLFGWIESTFSKYLYFVFLLPTFIPWFGFFLDKKHKLGASIQWFQISNALSIGSLLALIQIIEKLLLLPL